MANATREERKLQKGQARLAKAEQKAAAEAERRAQKEARKSRRKGGGEPVGEEDTVPEAAAPAPFVPRLELVTEPGPVKHLHWDAEARARIAEKKAAARSRPALPAAPAAEPLPEEAPAPSQLLGRRRTLYTTERGNQVVAYGRGGSRQLALTEERGGELQEVPFDESRVDRIIGSESEAPLQEAQEAPLAEAETKAGKPKRGFFRRRKAEAAPASTQPVVEHIYRPVEPVATLTTETVAAPAPRTQREQAVEAWEPDGALRQVHRAQRVPSARPAPSKPTRAAPSAKPRRRARRKPARIYPGDNHPVIDIEGIGPTYAKKLEAMGVTTTGLLNVAQPGRIAARLQVPRKTVRKWQAQAELIKVRGIGPQFAEALARSGVSGIDELKRRKPDDLAKQVAKYLAGVDQTVVGQPLTAKRIARWKRKAQPMRRVKANLERLAVPTHGIPPPWLREDATGRKGKKTARKAARKSARKTPRKAARPARRGK
ncbi:MAG: DUF4332 domain-containing protein [Halobacteriales archaeon]|nr:DUF4332 domain-containing protein [Halobacteriales archaeon]